MTIATIHPRAFGGGVSARWMRNPSSVGGEGAMGGKESAILAPSALWAILLHAPTRSIFGVAVVLRGGLIMALPVGPSTEENNGL
jgi:hypothetical protein